MTMMPEAGFSSAFAEIRPRRFANVPDGCTVGVVGEESSDRSVMGRLACRAEAEAQRLLGEESDWRRDGGDGAVKG